MDVSLPESAWSQKGRFWFLAERSGFLRPVGVDAGGTVTLAFTLDGQTQEHTYPFPAFDQHSNGRAGPIVQCYLVQSNCAETTIALNK